MRLGDLPGSLGLRVERDAAFGALGFVTHETPARLGFVAEARWLSALEAAPGLAAVITTADLAAAVPARLGLAVSDRPRQAFYAVHAYLARETGFYARPAGTGIDPSARVHPSAVVPASDVTIGARTLLEPHVTIFPGTVVGADCVLRAGAVIGAEGFQFDVADGPPVAVPHAGGVRLGDRVEVQSNTVIDRAVFGGFTEVGDDTKIDNLVHVAHNVRLGRRCRVVALAMIGGSVVVGDDAWIGPHAAISDNLRVGDGASISLGAVVTRDVPAGARVTGNFAVPHDRFLAHLRTYR
jgi:UDP-3-O-[3-hydroxymyristoyl] glucosamine N-acyltransferase